MRMKRITIPKEISGMPILDAVSLYHDDFDWVIHPLKGPSGGMILKLGSTGLSLIRSCRTEIKAA